MTRLGEGEKLLTCVMPKGVGLPLLRRLSDELGIVTASLHSARGLVGSDPGGVFNRVEKDVLTVPVPAPEADALFLWVYREARVSTEPGRFLYVAPLRGVTPFRLPEDVPAEKA